MARLKHEINADLEELEEKYERLADRVDDLENIVGPIEVESDE